VIRSRIQMALHTVMIDCVIEHVPIIGGGIVKSPHGRGRPPWRMKMVLVAR
jgi:hypothetical protein